MSKAYNRPVPDDFVERSKTQTQAQLMAHYGVSNSTITRWRKMAGLPIQKQISSRSRPADFFERAAAMTFRQLMKHYRCGGSTITRWQKSPGLVRPSPEELAEQAKRMTRKELCALHGVGKDVMARWLKEAGVQALTPYNRKRAVPGDWAEVAPTMIKTALGAHYGCELQTINRWIAETGVEPAVYVRSTKTKAKAQPNWMRPERLGTGSLHDMRRRDDLDCAADTLRREGFKLHRCDGRGRFDLKGKFWRSGNTLLTPGELLARAAKYQRVAA